jgi:hypothetical protein
VSFLEELTASAARGRIDQPRHPVVVIEPWDDLAESRRVLGAARVRVIAA